MTFAIFGIKPSWSCAVSAECYDVQNSVCTDSNKGSWNHKVKMDKSYLFWGKIRIPVKKLSWMVAISAFFERKVQLNYNYSWKKGTKLVLWMLLESPQYFMIAALTWVS